MILLKIKTKAQTFFLQTSPRIDNNPPTSSTSSYHSFDPIRNTSGPPSLIQEEDENWSTCSVSTNNLSTIFLIEVINDTNAPHVATNGQRRTKRMVSNTTMLSYTDDYTTEFIVRKSIKENQQRELTENQRMAQIRNNLRYPSIVFDAFNHNTILLTEQGVGQQHQGLTFFNRNRHFTDQVSRFFFFFLLILVSFKL